MGRRAHRTLGSPFMSTGVELLCDRDVDMATRVQDLLEFLHEKQQELDVAEAPGTVCATSPPAGRGEAGKQRAARGARPQRAPVRGHSVCDHPEIGETVPVPDTAVLTHDVTYPPPGQP